MILAVDLGSTRFKAGVFDLDLSLCGAGSHLLAHQFSAGGRVEIEVDEVTGAFRRAVQEALSNAQVQTENLEVIAITSQAQTFTVLDPSGQEKTPFISWQDTRAHETCEMLKQDRRLDDFGEHGSFGELLSVQMICQIAHLQTTHPGFLAAEDWVLHLPAFLVYQLTGEPVLDANLAAMCGLYSLQLHDWWSAALEVCHLRPEQLGRLVPIGALAGRTGPAARRFGLSPGIPVILAGNDQTAGAYGAQLHKKRGLLITLGTAQVAYVCSSEPYPPDAGLCRGPYPGGLHYRLAADSCGGAVINWAQRILAGCGSDEDFFAEADKANSGCQGLRFDADLSGGAGAWSPIGLHHTRADFARSVVESLSRRMAGMIERLGVDLAGVNLLATGGGSHCPTWVRIQSEALGVPIASAEANPLNGAARMAAVARHDMLSGDIQV